MRLNDFEKKFCVSVGEVINSGFSLRLAIHKAIIAHNIRGDYDYWYRIASKWCALNLDRQSKKESACRKITTSNKPTPRKKLFRIMLMPTPTEEILQELGAVKFWHDAEVHQLQLTNGAGDD